jgi:predicted lipid-binding transport protein (Tim44 family)
LEGYSGNLTGLAGLFMFYALVHIIRKKTSKKQTILKKYFKGELAEIVYGQGGGE